MTSLILSRHALDRCTEMGIDPDRVGRVTDNPDLTYCSRNGYTVMCRTDEPSFRVVVDERQDPVVVITVIWWTSERYERSA